MDLFKNRERERMSEQERGGMSGLGDRRGNELRSKEEMEMEEEERRKNGGEEVVMGRGMIVCRMRNMGR